MELKENNNSKKLIIGVSILFCTVILIIGGTIAFFTQSAGQRLDDIVSTDEVTLDYNDDTTYMREGLIPSSEEYAIRAYNKTENKCIDDNGYSICSVYQFTITNTSDVAQDLIISMTPTINTFTNLKYMLYEVNEGVSNQVLSTQPLIYNDKTTLSLVEDLTLSNGTSKTYEIVYYILNLPNEDQTSLDAGKNFGATININSVTTGTYISNQEGATCWVTEPLEDGSNNYRLAEFLGIDNETGEVVDGCGDYVTKTNGFYSIEVPSTYGGNKITTLGNRLFSVIYMPYEGDAPTLKPYYTLINKVEINNGITTIEDGGGDSDDGDLVGTFLAIGMDINNGGFLTNFNLDVTLPASLEYVGAASFFGTAISSINIPASVKEIGDSAFSESILINVSFEDTIDNPSQLTTIGIRAFGYVPLTSLNLPSNLKTIGEYAFSMCNLTYESEDNPLIIPANVTSIGTNAFENITMNYGTLLSNINLLHIEYLGMNSDVANNTTEWYRSNKTSLSTPNYTN